MTDETQASRRAFLRKAGVVTGSAALLTFGGLTNLSKAGAQSPPNAADSTSDILNAAVTAEQLATTFYYLGLLGAGLGQLPAVQNVANLNYFQAALWQEYTHATLLESVGGISLVGSTPQFYFPTGVFEKQGLFFHVLDALETAFIGAYTAAIGEWAGDSPSAVSTTGPFTGPQLAKVAAQFLGTEAEHRVLGRVAAGINPPNNLILERAPYVAVGTPASATGTAVGALLPFVTGGTGFSGPYALPSKKEVLEASSPFNRLFNPGLAAP